MVPPVVGWGKPKQQAVHEVEKALGVPDQGGCVYRVCKLAHTNCI